MWIVLKRTQIWLSLAILLAAVWVSLREPLFLVAQRELVFDGYQRLAPRTYRPIPVRVIDIDDETLARTGQWPWPRTRIADLVRRLRERGAATVAFDLLFSEPDRTSPSTRLDSGLRDVDPQQWAAIVADHDAELATAVGEGPTVTGLALIGTPGIGLPAVKAGFVFSGDDPRPFLPRFVGAVPTLARIEQAAAGNGALNVSLSAGGVIRRIPLFSVIGETIYPSLSMEALRIAQGADTYLIKTSTGGGEGLRSRPTGVTQVRVGAFTVPTDATGQAWVHFTEPVPERFVPAWKVLAGDVDRALIEGSIVLIGSTAAGLQDIHAGPLGYAMPGVSVHAQFLEQVILSAHLRRPDWAKGAEVLLLVGLALTLLILGYRIGPVWTAFVGLLGASAAFAASWYAFANLGILLDPLFPAGSVLAVYLVFSVLRHLQTEREQRWIRKAFSSYVSPKLVRELVENPDHLRLTGERRELTCLFTDLEGFTSLIERSEPTVILPVLNAYLDGMIRIAFAHDGTVDKIVGDALHIIFGAPIALPDHGARAVACALDLDRFAQRFAEDQRRAGIPFGRTRIGVNSGIATVGNFGGEMRFDYTAHGDVVNTAARLEGANKALGTRICISGTTVALCPGFSGRPAGALVLKGKSEATEVFEPLPPDRMNGESLALYLTAFERMRAGDACARDALAQVLKLDPGDPLAAFHLRRLGQGETGTRIVLTEK